MFEFILPILASSIAARENLTEMPLWQRAPCEAPCEGTRRVSGNNIYIVRPRPAAGLWGRRVPTGLW
jgi:hypothetical protein